MLLAVAIVSLIVTGFVWIGSFLFDNERWDFGTFASVYLFLFLLFGGAAYLQREASKSIKKETDAKHEEIRQEGRKAAKLNIPATANPYKYESHTTQWLKGYMEFEQENLSEVN